MAKNKITFADGIVTFESGDGLVQQVSPQVVYTVFGVDTVTFKLVALPKESGLCILTSKAQDLEVDGVTYTIDELPDVLAEKFADSGAVAKVEIVDELPASGKTNILYLVPSDTEGEYDEYIWLEDEERFELIGSTTIDLDGYVTEEVFSAYTAGTQTVLGTISGDVDDISDELNALSGDVATVSGNVDELLSDVAIISGDVADKADASALTEHTSDTTIHVTSSEKDAWNAKADEADLIELSGNILSQVDVLSGKVDENEQVTSASLNDLDLRLLGLDGAVVELEGDSDDLWDAINELANDMDDKADVSALTAYTTATEVNTLIDNAVSGKQDTLSAGTGIIITDNVISVTGGGGGADLEALSGQVQDMDRVVAIALNTLNQEVSGKADTSALTEYTTASEVNTLINGAVSGKADSQDVNTLSGQVQDMDRVVAIALNTLNQEVSGKADASALTAYTTTSEVANMISGKADSQDVNTLSGQVQTMDRVVAISLNQINNDLGGVKLVLISQSNYDNLPVKDSHTLYIINDVQ